jgi:hypothetical protein
MRRRSDYDFDNLANDDAFDTAWRDVEEDDDCDSIGGMEYWQVRAEWEACRDDVRDIRSFIRERANILPGSAS